MQFLELPEGDNHIGLFGQFLSALAQGCLDFQVFLEIVFPEFVVDFEQVVKPLHVYLIIFPEFVDLILRNRACLFPGLLKPPEFRQCPAYVFRAFGQQADISSMIVFFFSRFWCALLFLFGVMFGSFLPPTVQQGLEFLFQGVIFSRFGALCFGATASGSSPSSRASSDALPCEDGKRPVKVVDAVFLVVAWLLN
jgi:hypothetical protein